MSNMDTNRNKVKAKNEQSKNKLEAIQNRKNFRQEEFISESDFKFDTKENNSVEPPVKKGIKQPVSERTAWN